MKRIIIAISFLIFIFSNVSSFAQCNDDLINVCTPSVGGGYTFLKSFPVRCNKSSKEAPETVKFTYMFNPGITYKIVACNAQEFQGKVIVTVTNARGLVGTSFDPATKKHYPIIEFQCTAGGPHTISFMFEDGFEGCAVGIVAQKN